VKHLTLIPKLPQSPDPTLNMLVRLTKSVELAYQTRYSFSTDNWKELYDLAQEAKAVIKEASKAAPKKA
jgi:hypothetical protein